MERLVSEQSLASGFATLEAALARHAHAFRDFHFTFGGRPARMRVAGLALAHVMTRPFMHLLRDQADGRPIEFDAILAEPDESQVGFESLIDPSADEDGLVDIATTGRFVTRRTPSSVVSFDRAAGRIVGLVRDPMASNVYEIGKPFARILAEWYADRGIAVVHAGLVALDGAGVLLAGRGGSGKSTSSLVCARSGFAFLGEDYAVIEHRDDGSVVGHSAYGSVFIDPAAAAWLPEVEPHLTASRTSLEPKSVVFVRDVWPDRLAQQAPIRAVALCRVGSSPTSRIRRATRAEALLSIGPSSLLQIHGRRHTSLEHVARLVERVPAFHLELGRDPGAVPRGVEAVLREAVG